MSYGNHSPHLQGGVIGGGSLFPSKYQCCNQQGDDDVEADIGNGFGLPDALGLELHVDGVLACWHVHTAQDVVGATDRCFVAIDGSYPAWIIDFREYHQPSVFRIDFVVNFVAGETSLGDRC